MMVENNQTDEELRENVRNNLSDEDVNEEYLEASIEAGLDTWNKMDQIDEESMDVSLTDVITRIYEYVKFDLDPEKAGRRILEEQAQKSDDLDISDIRPGNQNTPEVSVKELDGMDENSFVTIVGEVDTLFEDTHESIEQKGFLVDRNGDRVVFVTWKKSDPPLLTEGTAYRLENVAVNKYEGNSSVAINNNTEVEIAEDFEVKKPEFTGRVVDIADSSGLIKRCPKEDCYHVIESGNCPEHGDVAGEFDMRLKATLDNGESTQRIIMNQDLTEDILEVSMSEAQEIAMESLQMQSVLNENKDKVMHKKLHVVGFVTNNDTFIVEEYDVVSDDIDTNELVNRVEVLRQSEQQQQTMGDLQ